MDCSATKKRKLERNRESAKRCRAKRKLEHNLIEERLKNLEETNRKLVEDNKRLRSLLSALESESENDTTGSSSKTPWDFLETRESRIVSDIVDGFFQ